jgi:heterodisulfide reductase subunit B
MTATYSYFPGCTLSTTARDYDESGRAICEALGVQLQELKEWNCCGATFPLSVENVMDMVGPARVLNAARDQGSDLATLCAVCFHVLKRTEHYLSTHGEAADRLNQFLDKGQYASGLRVRHLLGVLRDDVGWEAIAARVRAPLSGMKMAPYYGCMLLRPQVEIGLDDSEGPTILGDLLAALGSEVVHFPHATECCGSYLAVNEPEATRRLSTTVVESARRAGAAMIVTACPLCQYNLEHSQSAVGAKTKVPVIYFTQVMAAAFGLAEHAGELRPAEA